MSSAEEVVYASPCPSCPAAAEVTAGLAWTGGRLEWGSEQHCPACGAGFPDCGRGEPPAALRGRLLAEHGPSRLEFPRAGAAVMKVLRAELGLSLAEVRRVVREGYEATGPEVAKLAEALRRAGPAG
ncbi:hypothetical protein AB0469_12850 [Streptomyces sp. NPDC093801]|uniref:hypothetical protein n=1 Tax=Streptomyces sp. NPDC093801 TaxID=3155203 RepID=UPI00344CDEA2